MLIWIKLNISLRRKTFFHKWKANTYIPSLEYFLGINIEVKFLKELYNILNTCKLDAPNSASLQNTYLFTHKPKCCGKNARGRKLNTPLLSFNFYF